VKTLQGLGSKPKKLPLMFSFMKTLKLVLFLTFFIFGETTSPLSNVQGKLNSFGAQNAILLMS